jgi:chromosome segregation ATPase
LTLLLLLASLGLSFGARAAEPVLGVALAVDSPDEATAVDPKPIKPKAVPHKTTTPVPKVEISDGIDLEADLKAIERGHVQVEAASKRTEAAMDRETHRAQQIQKQKQDLMIPDAEMAMITKNRTMGLVLLKHRDSSIQDLQKSVGSLKSEVDKIQASNSLLSDKLLKVEDKQKESQRQAKEVVELQTEEANLQEQLGQLLAQSKVAERDSVTAAIREGDNLEDANQKEALLKKENRKLRAQNAVLKKQIAAQLRALKAKRSELGKASNVLKTEASQQTHMIQVLRANRTRLQKEVDALSHEDARWRRKVAHLKPLEAKVQQEAGREDKLMKASAALAKNLKKAQISLAGLS